MANYENLLDSIDAVIRSNNRREITGQILQNTLHQMVASLGENYQLAGFATPTLDPSEPDQNVFYLTDEAGVYTNFDNITLGNGLSFLMWKNGAWSSKTMNIVTAQWVDNNYVSKAFLRQLFRAYDEDGVEIFANDTTSIIDNIKAMCGLWTNQYLSALGLGADGGGGASTLAGLNDVQLDNLQDGQALVYDLASNHWVNRTIQSGVDMSVVWAALAAATNEQINASHLTTALSGYVTSTALATTLANYVTTTALASALADYAAQSWVETNYISKSFFNSLFQAEDSEGNAITPNNSGQTVIDRLKILVGAYTDQYLSALGLSEEAGASSYLYGLGDVQLDTQTLASGQALIYSASLGKWTNGEAGVNMAQVWTALATADATKQIDISHISSALSGYVTASSLSTTLASYVTTSALSTTLADYVTNTSLTTTLAAYGTKSWVESNYISKAFFNRMFRAFAPVAEGESEAAQVEPNDVTTEIDNIKAMFGLWTEQYLSALGLGSDAGHTIGVLNDLNDVTITNPQNDQVLKYNNGIWVNAAAPSGATALSGLTDVAISSLADKDLLQWDYATGKWKNVVLSTAMSAYALASAIPTNVSQLNNDSGYITGITSSMITSALGYTPANSTALSNYLPLSGGVINANNEKAPLILKGGVGDFREGLRIIPHGGWADILLAGSDANEDSGTSPNSWFIGNYRGNFYITRNGSGSSSSARLACTNNSWSINGYDIIHSGNIGSQSVNYASSAGSVAWSNVSGRPTALSSFTNDSGYITSSGSCAYATSAGSANYATPHRITSINDLNGWEMFTGENVTGGLGSSWMQGICVLPNDDHGGYRCILSFYPYSTAAELYIITQSGGTWGGWRKLLTNANSSVSKSGETLTVTIDGTSYSLTNTDHTYNFVGAYFVSGDMSNAIHDCNSMLYNGVWYYNNNGPSTSIGASTTDGALYSQAYNTNWVAQIAQDYRNGRLFVRGRNGDLDAFSDWKRIAQYDEIVPKSGGTFENYLNIRKTMVNDNWDALRIWYNGGWSEALNKLAFINFTDSSGSVGKIGVGYNGSTGFISLGWLYNGSYGGSGEIVRITTSGLVSNGGVTALSDIRHKTIVEDTSLQVNDIARMRAVRYLWNDGRKDNDIHVGSIAQDWQQILPEVVLRANNDEGTLSLQYGVAALISSITIARKVVNHEERIKVLEKENADLKQAYSFIKNAYDYLKMDYEQLKLKIA